MGSLDCPLSLRYAFLKEITVSPLFLSLTSFITLSLDGNGGTRVPGNSSAGKPLRDSMLLIDSSFPGSKFWNSKLSHNASPFRITRSNPVSEFSRKIKA
jgi:hypothetical protein